MSVERPRLIAGAACILFVVISSIIIIGNYQNHNGDFGQYYLHANNLIHGRNWGLYLENKPSVLIGYPILIAPSIFIFGLNGYAIGFMNSTLWAAAIYIYYIYFEERFRTRFGGYIFIVLALFMRYVLYFQQDGQPIIAYAFCFALALYAAKLLKDKPLSVFLAAGMLLAALFRIESAALYAAIFLWLVAIGRWRVAWVPIVGVALTVGLDISLAQISPVRSNIIHALSMGKASGGLSSSAFETVNNVVTLAGAHLLSLAEIILPDYLVRPHNITYIADYGLKHKVAPVHFIIPMIVAIGFVLEDRRKYLDLLAFMAHVAITSMLLMKAIPIRYMIPIAPIAVFYLVYVVETLLLHLTQYERFASFRSFVFSLVVIVSVVIAYSNVNKVHGIPRTANTLITRDAQDLSHWLAKNQNGRLVGYWKDRLMMVLLDVAGGDPSKVVGVRSIKQAADLLDEEGILVLMVQPKVNRPAAAEVEAIGKIVFQNDSFKAYSKSP